jgi:hypothetical protein
MTKLNCPERLLLPLQAAASAADKPVYGVLMKTLAARFEARWAGRKGRR